jgi:hypothetical protein
MAADIFIFPEREIAPHPQSNVGPHGYPDPAPFPAERFSLQAWAGGYAIYDGADLVCTFHGARFDLAGKTLRLLEAEHAPEIVTDMLAASVAAIPNDGPEAA